MEEMQTFPAPVSVFPGVWGPRSVLLAAKLTPKDAEDWLGEGEVRKVLPLARGRKSNLCVHELLDRFCSNCFFDRNIKSFEAVCLGCASK